MKFLIKISLIFLSIYMFSCDSENHSIEENSVEENNLNTFKSKWNPNDLLEVNYFEIGNIIKNKTTVEKLYLNDGLLVQEISNAAYELAKHSQVKHYLKDTLFLMKFDNQIKIAQTVFKDRKFNNNRFENYSYIGYFPVVDQYLIKGNYKDSVDFKLVDKNTGTIKISLFEYPYISKEGNFMAVIKNDCEFNQTYFEIVSYNNGIFKKVLKANFVNWSVESPEEFSFWGNDGSFYVRAKSIQNCNIINETEKPSFLKITLN